MTVSQYFFGNIDISIKNRIHFITFFHNMSLLFDPLLITSRFHRDRLDRGRHGFAYVLLLFQCISLRFASFLITSRFDSDRFER